MGIRFGSQYDEELLDGQVETLLLEVDQTDLQMHLDRVRARHLAEGLQMGQGLVQLLLADVDLPQSVSHQKIPWIFLHLTQLSLSATAATRALLVMLWPSEYSHIRRC